MDFARIFVEMVNENIQIVAGTGPRSGAKVLQLKGPLNIHTIFEFQETMRAEASPVVIIDFGGVPYVDSAGLGAMVGAFVSAQRNQRKLAFAGMNTQVKALVDMTHVNQLLRPYASVEEADRAIAAPN
jgi:anti-sigma B factor antagonist